MFIELIFYRIEWMKMSCKSRIEDMKADFGSVSSKSFGSRSRSQSVVDDSSIETADDSEQSFWADLPPELLTDVLRRIEASECTWPSRKNVIACAGVCRSWRKNMKEIAQVPEISGQLTFPISLKQPGSRDPPMKCYIERDRSTQTYYLYLSSDTFDELKFLLAAKRCRRPTCTDYIISLNCEDVTKDSDGYIGKLRANFLGTKFRVYDAQPPKTAALATKFHLSKLGSNKRVLPKIPAGNYPVSTISYAVNVLGARGPRQMQCVMNTIPATAIEPGGSAPTQTEFQLSNPNSSSSPPLSQSKSIHLPNSQSGSFPAQVDPKLVLKNKSPRWNPHLQCWCLNFNGRVSVASVKNFQLVACSENEDGVKEHEDLILQFGKVAKDEYTMDFRYPLSVFQAFAICLSSFETKIACE